MLSNASDTQAVLKFLRHKAGCSMYFFLLSGKIWPRDYLVSIEQQPAVEISSCFGQSGVEQSEYSLQKHFFGIWGYCRSGLFFSQLFLTQMRAVIPEIKRTRGMHSST